MYRIVPRGKDITRGETAGQERWSTGISQDVWLPRIVSPPPPAAAAVLSWDSLSLLWEELFLSFPFVLTVTTNHFLNSLIIHTNTHETHCLTCGIFVLRYTYIHSHNLPTHHHHHHTHITHTHLLFVLIFYHNNVVNGFNVMIL